MYNLRRDPYEKAAEESGMYIRWLGDKMWAFGPAARIVQQHIATLKAFPPRSASLANEEQIKEQTASELGLSQ